MQKGEISVIANLLEKISEFEQQLAVLKAEVEKEEKENKRWRGKEGDIYWFVESNRTPSWLYECNKDSDNFRYDTHNYFQTEDEARRYAKVLETERQLKKFADEYNGDIDWGGNSLIKRCLCYNYNAQSICTRSVWAIREPRVIYFSSEEIARQAIDEIGEEKIKEYLTYEW